MIKEKSKNIIFNFSFFISLLICYIDVYKYGKEFFFQTEIKFLTSIFNDSLIFFFLSILLIGQFSLLVAPFNKKYNGLTSVGVLFTFPFWLIIILFSHNNLFSIISSIPFIIILIVLIFKIDFKSLF